MKHYVGYISKVLCNCAEVTKVEEMAVLSNMMFSYWHKDDEEEKKEEDYQKAVAIDAITNKALSYIRVGEWVYVEDVHKGKIDGRIVEETTNQFVVKFNFNPKVNSAVYIDGDDK